MRVPAFVRAAAVFLCCVFSCPAFAQVQQGPQLAESMVTAMLPGRSISALVTHLNKPGEFKRAVILLPGHPGIMNLKSVSEPYGMKGNFLIRSRRHWLDPETIVLSVDAPTDQWCCFRGSFRATPRYAQDLAALRAEFEKTYGKLPWFIVGTSEGSVSAYYAALALQQPGDKVIFSSSLFNSSANSQGLYGQDFSGIKVPMLWVHHENDGCSFTPYGAARKMAEQTRSPLITVNASTPARSGPCEGMAAHGFIGAERETVRAMKQWALTGEAHDVTLP